MAKITQKIAILLSFVRVKPPFRKLVEVWQA